MRPSVGFWDAIFGKKVTIELPATQGGVRKIRVTKKWLEKMEAEGKMTPTSQDYVQVHVLDPTAGAMAMFGLEEGPESAYRVEHWVVGEDVDEASYDKFVDPSTQALYALRDTKEGESTVYLVQKQLWLSTKAAMGE